VSRDFELGPNLSGLSKIAYLVIASGNLGMFERQMGVASLASTRVRWTALAMLTPARRPLAVRKSYFETGHAYFGVVLCQCRWFFK